MVDIDEARTKLSKLVEAAEAGGKVILARAGRPVVRIVRLEPSGGVRLGTLKGRIPVDTHVLLGDAGNEGWVSSASVWEIAIKSALGNIRGEFSLGRLEHGIDEAGLLPLDVTLRLLTADEVLARLPVAISC